MNDVENWQVATDEVVKISRLVTALPISQCAAAPKSLSQVVAKTTPHLKECHAYMAAHSIR